MPEWIRVTKDHRIVYYPSGIKGVGIRKAERVGKTDAEAEARVRVIIKEVELGASLKLTRTLHGPLYSLHGKQNMQG